MWLHDTDLNIDPNGIQTAFGVSVVLSLACVFLPEPANSACTAMAIMGGLIAAATTAFFIGLQEGKKRGREEMSFLNGKAEASLKKLEEKQSKILALLEAHPATQGMFARQDENDEITEEFVTNASNPN